MLRKMMTAGLALAASATMALSADLSKMSWDEIVAQAKEEGELTWYVWYFRDNFREQVKAFEKEYGITVNIPEGTNSGNQDKLLAERDRETGDIDAFSVSFNVASVWDFGDLFLKIDATLPKDDGRVQEVTGLEGQGYLFAFWGNQTGIAYDPAEVDESALPQTPEEFAAFWAANPERFGFNYEKGGSGISFFHNMLRSTTDVDYFAPGDSEVEARVEGLAPGFAFFNTHADNYVVTASNADSLTRLSDRELIMVPTWEDFLAGRQKRGEVRTDLKFYVPEMGMSGGGNGVAVAKNAAHPAAALVFVNWLTSAATQTKFNQDFGTAPMHADADASAALIPEEQRAFRQAWPTNPFRQQAQDAFIEEVILNR